MRRSMLHGTDGIVTKPSPRCVPEEMSRLTLVVETKGLTPVVDHSGAAAKVGLRMSDTKLALFGSPAGAHR